MLHTGSVGSGLKLQPVISGVISRPPGDAGGPQHRDGWSAVEEHK